MNIGGKGEEKWNTAENQFLKNICSRLFENQNEKWKGVLQFLWSNILGNSVWEPEIKTKLILFTDNLKSKLNMAKNVWMIKHLSKKGLISIEES